MSRLEIPDEIRGADRLLIEALVASGAASLRDAIDTWYHSRGRKSPREQRSEPDQDELERRHP